MFLLATIGFLVGRLMKRRMVVWIGAVVIATVSGNVAGHWFVPLLYPLYAAPDPNTIGIYTYTAVYLLAPSIKLAVFTVGLDGFSLYLAAFFTAMGLVSICLGLRLGTLEYPDSWRIAN